MSEPSAIDVLPLTPDASPTSRRCSRRAATRNGAGAPTFDSAVATGPTRRRPAIALSSRHCAKRDLALASSPIGMTGRRLGQPRAARGLRAPGLLEDPRPARRCPRLVDRLLRRLAAVSPARVSRRPSSTRAIEYARSHGATTLEAYPVEVPTGERIPAANAYHGTLTMFERAGFTVVERRQWNATTPVRPIVRRAL